MSFFAVLLALLVEQLKPLPHGNAVHRAVVNWARWAGRNFDAGRPHHAWVVWTVTVVAPAVLVCLIYAALRWHSLLLALVFDVVVLYVTLGFRQFSHYFTDIRMALERGDELEARNLLAQWQHLDASELPRSELLRHVIEHSLLAAHRHVFGVFFWFVVLSAVGLGPMGAVLYRLAEFASRYWAFRNQTLDTQTHEGLRQRSERSFAWVDHVPARLTATGFAIVGNFEEAVNGMRRDAALWLRPNEGVILAAAAGAVGVQLGGAAAPGVTPDRSKTLAAGAIQDATAADGSTPGEPATLGHLQAIVRLVWRSVVLWMLLLALLTVSNLIG
ncbi:CobD/CbiB family protein [Inhella gelatinilytica]|uniref:Cobalamin biosynthesis protein CobD n=1 Tax=Inhella gelatinilytica TaxID=2795030 RepID=A0A931IZJ6_9BURK|nr:CobD/CbiB family protein [Inhella gelatinilytica]MBH9552848.1 CobD/CbiB family protein [Inhella gelatinilytica]